MIFHNYYVLHYIKGMKNVNLGAKDGGYFIEILKLRKTKKMILGFFLMLDE